MDFGDVWMALGMDLSVLQGAVNHLYREDPAFSVVEGTGFRLELVIPTFEIRPACGPKPYRVGIHLLGNLFIGTQPALLFDAWVGLTPGVIVGDDDIPVGTLRFVEVENVTPDFAKAQLEAQFADDGRIGKVLSTFSLPLFKNLLASATVAMRAGTVISARSRSSTGSWSTTL